MLNLIMTHVFLNFKGSVISINLQLYCLFLLFDNLGGQD